MTTKICTDKRLYAENRICRVNVYWRCSHHNSYLLLVYRCLSFLCHFLLPLLSAMLHFVACVFPSFPEVPKGKNAALVIPLSYHRLDRVYFSTNPGSKQGWAGAIHNSEYIPSYCWVNTAITQDTCAALKGHDPGWGGQTDPVLSRV